MDLVKEHSEIYYIIPSASLKVKELNFYASYVAFEDQNQSMNSRLTKTEAFNLQS